MNAIQQKEKSGEFGANRCLQNSDRICDYEIAVMCVQKRNTSVTRSDHVPLLLVTR